MKVLYLFSISLIYALKILMGIFEFSRTIIRITFVLDTTLHPAKTWGHIVKERDRWEFEVPACVRIDLSGDRK